MNKRKTLSGLVLIIFLFFINGNSFAQYRIKNSVLGNSATPTGDTQQQIAGTTGQSATGTTQNTSYIHKAGFWYQEGSALTSIEKMESEILPTEYSLKQNYPNPFNPTTTIVFAVPKPAHVIVKLFDMLGRKVATLVDAHKEAGEYKILFDAGHLPSGIYYYQMKAEAFSQIKKLMLLK